jgi:hypothetical protein
MIAVKQAVSPSPPPLPPPPDDDWDTFVLHDQVIKLRRHTCGPSDALIAPPPGCAKYVLPTVSARDPRRHLIDLWTSRNRAACIGRRHVIAEILEYLTRHRDLDELRSSPPVALTASEAEQVAGALRLVLDWSR